jgi:hypothetical protein
MELIMDYKEGNLINEGNTLYLVLFKTLYNVVILEFSRNMLVLPYSEWNSNLPIFSWKNYDLTNKDDIEKLNVKYAGNYTNNTTKFPVVYDVELGSVVDYDYRQMMLMGQTDRKILSFTLTRPILFDFNKAKEKYIVFDRLNKLSDLQGEFNSNWSEYLITPFASKENIDWTVVRDRLPFEELIGKEFIENEFAPYPTEKITLDEFYSVINTKKLNQIKDESIKNEIKELIKQTLILAKENNSIGIKLEPKEPTTASKEEKRFNIEFTYKLTPSDREVLMVEEYVYGIDEQDALAKAPNYFYDIYEGKNYDLISVSAVEETEPKNNAEPITDISDEVLKVTPPVNKVEKPIEETEDLNELLELYKIEETENLDDLLKLYE